MRRYHGDRKNRANPALSWGDPSPLEDERQCVHRDDDQSMQSLERRLTRVLRHSRHLRMDSQGYVTIVDTLLALRLQPSEVEKLSEIVRTSCKDGQPRFSFSEDGKRIKANGKHSTRAVRPDFYVPANHLGIGPALVDESKASPLPLCLPASGETTPPPRAWTDVKSSAASAVTCCQPKAAPAGCPTSGDAGWIRANSLDLGVSQAASSRERSHACRSPENVQQHVVPPPPPSPPSTPSTPPPPTESPSPSPLSSSSRGMAGGQAVVALERGQAVVALERETTDQVFCKACNFFEENDRLTIHTGDTLYELPLPETNETRVFVVRIPPGAKDECGKQVCRWEHLHCKAPRKGDLLSSTDFSIIDQIPKDLDLVSEGPPQQVDNRWLLPMVQPAGFVEVTVVFEAGWCDRDVLRKGNPFS
eukprot:TRINITY_DN8846_c0_g1_i1.p1 TRINITY_DN8846_c0_g1~~TRINITY_DN8846_c0_g1_i1.p1  ORF type:complete len:419 (-),score=65.19 TRINITY_DN8846_c0_g1_i1:89-1345(-)